MNEDRRKIVKLGARGSLLSRLQSGMVAQMVEEASGGAVKVELVIVTTSGDVIQDRPLHEMGGKGLFTKELEQALLRREVDFAVHSFKDVPVTMPLVEQGELTVAAVPPREDARDLLISTSAKRIGDLPQAAKVGTGSLRRRSQLLAIRPDLQVEGIRGNIDTRLRKAQAGTHAAIILAMAGIKRAALYDTQIMTPIEVDELLPAAGQGSLSIQCRKKDQKIIECLKVLHHEPTATCVMAERELVRLLEGDCFSPIAADAKLAAGKLELKATVGKRGGEAPLLKAACVVDVAKANEAAKCVFEELSRQGVKEHLHGR